MSEKMVWTDTAHQDRRAADSLIEIEGLGLAYRSRRDKISHGALIDINLTVYRGEFVSVVGPSGCGKSTLLYLLAGLLQKSEGSARINGNEVTGPGTDRGLVMQSYALVPWRTVQKNVELGLEIKHVPKAERIESARYFIDLVGLSDYAGRYPHELSGGMKQRIAIARALAFDPDVLLMDEPFAAVDEQTRGFLHNELLRIWKATRKTIIFVTHSIEEAVYLSDRVAVMSPGPGTIRVTIDIDVPRPRTAEMKSSERFGKHRSRIWQLLHNDSDMAREGYDDSGRKILISVPQETLI
jgi:NitT/TauT family transport system ATP-binding protein